MRRRLAHVVFVTGFGALGLVLGVLGALTVAPSGRRLLARTVTGLSDRIFRGHLTIGAVSGNFINHLELTGVVLTDSSGATVAEFPLLDVRYHLANLLARRFDFVSLRAESPVIDLVRRRNGRMNYEEVLHLGEGPGGGRPPLIEFHDLELVGGTLTLRLPWDPPKGASPRQRDSALAAERAIPGRVIVPGAEGLELVRRFDSLALGLERLTVSTPNRDPLSMIIDTLGVRVSDPGVRVQQARGRARVHGDSLVFEITRGALPASRFQGGGAVTWPDGPLLFDFAMRFSELDLVDLRWVSPDFPPLHGRAVVVAKSADADRVSYALQELHLENDTTRIDGQLVALTDRRLGLGVRDMDLTIVRLDLEAARPYLDTLPLRGSLSGRVAGSGFLSDMDLSFDVQVTDIGVPGGATSSFAGRGHLLMGGAEGLSFSRFALASSDVDLRTVQLLTPSVTLQGRASLSGNLEGPWKNVLFTGTMRHQDGERPVSAVAGWVRLDTRTLVTAFDGDLTLDSLSFEGIRAGYPTLPSLGSLTGQVRLLGTLDRMDLDADVQGEIGSLRMRGTATAATPHWGGDSLTIDFRHLNLHALRGIGPTSDLTGSVLVNGSIDTLRAPEGSIAGALGPGRIAAFRLDTAAARLAVRDSVLLVDTLAVEWHGGAMDAQGTIGWVQPHEGQLQLHARFDSLRAFDSLLVDALGLGPDSAEAALQGRGQVELSLSGSLDSLVASGFADASQVRFRGGRINSISATIGWLGGSRPEVSLELLADTVAAGRMVATNVRAGALGPRDALEWSTSFESGDAAALGASGRYSESEGERRIAFDSLAMALTGHVWRLQAPASATSTDSGTVLTPLRLESVDGSGAIDISGSVPGDRPGSLQMHVYGLDLRDVAGLLRGDTTGVSGSIGADLQISGTRLAPVIDGTASLGDAAFGDFRSPFIQGILHYDTRLLQGNLSIWKTGQRILVVDLALPLDLAFATVPRRQIEGPLRIRAHADSLDLGTFEAFTTSVRRVSGILSVDARVEGTWQAPRLAGFIDVRNGQGSVPGLGVRYSTITGHAVFMGDSLILDSLLLQTSPGVGSLRASGSVRFNTLTNPTVNMGIVATDFRATDIRGFLTLEGSGRMRLAGPLRAPTLTGSVTANRGALYFADLVTKDVVDLDDPEFRDLLDQRFQRMLQRGYSTRNRFVDSLRVENLRVRVGEAFWLRSNEANIQLGGEVRVDKQRRDYRVDGRLDALRGSYTLAIGPVRRDFKVQKGQVRFLGTPDLNADLDIEAEHIVRPLDGTQDVPVIAKITGTLLEPKLELTSTILPPISETNLVSYLMFRRPASTLQTTSGATGDQQQALNLGLAYLSSAVTSELQRTLITDLRVPVDYIELRPGTAGGAYGSSTATQLAAGWQIGRKTFLTFSAGICTTGGATSYKNIGASFEYRFARGFRFLASFEPSASCTADQQTAPITTNDRYQAGLDVLWEQEF
ncbi:MAG TPA: translocation/assembly module TamB domain-containing protein [Gemmatimonadales bacterium]|nr:translocation/assembly module TamB domain-containing protein [Gemmatimonadales bacterium]